MTASANKKKPGFKTPFSISPNPNNLYFTPALEAVLFRVRFTVEQRQGLTVILGDVGLGKSSLVRYLHVEFDASEDIVSILIPTPDFKSDYAMVATICGACGLPPRRSIQAHQRELEEWLGEQYVNERNVVLFIDEAQKLKPSMLESVRALLNYETNEEKLMQIVLAGQLELRDKLLSPAMKPLYSRMMAPSLLSPLTLDELSAMIDHRCEIYKVANPFPPDTVELLFKLTGGIPREALRLCAIAYEFSKLARAKEVSTDLLSDAHGELQLREANAPAEEQAAPTQTGAGGR
ncbi:MAG TPA: AAA family ATPase [Pyrinomonadaceae bacterium]